jgi:hypothetical protein
MLLNSCIFVIFFLGGWHYDHIFLIELWKTLLDPFRIILHLIYSFVALIFVFITSFFYVIKENIFIYILENFYFNPSKNQLIFNPQWFLIFDNFFVYPRNFILHILYFFFVSSKIVYLVIIPKIIFGFIAKVIFIACLFIIVRALLPRYRFDQLMDLCWKKILPVSASFFLFFITLIYFFNGFLYNLEINILNPKKLITLYYSIM